MSVEDYRKALKMGQKTFRACVARGEYPYLQVLDDILENSEVERMERLGVVDVPIDAIVGTKTAGRKTAFAANFMPLLPERSEFAIKWINLCEAQLTEGIRDPIQVYEFMNRFYVQEGNKRVSVLKYFGAASLPASVIRLVPHRTDSKENKIYYEFMGFYALTGINYLRFSQPGRFAKLLKYVNKQPGQPWSEDDKKTFASVYYRFAAAFAALGGKKLPITIGDALLAFLKIYPYDSVPDLTDDGLRQRLENAWPEVLVLTEESGIELSLAAGAVPEAPLITRLLPVNKGVLRCAFIHERTPRTSAWTYAHEFGRSQAEELLGGRVTTTAYCDVQVGVNDDEVLEQAIRDGNTVLFTTTPKLMDATLRASVRHPEVKLFNCSLNMKHPAVRTYYGRIYEAKFIVGAIAGAMADDNRIGYVANYPIYGMTAGINAFALGAQMTNPRAKIYLEWSAAKGPAPAQRLAEQGVTLISGQDIRPPAGGPPAGLYQVEEDGREMPLAVPFWHWGAFYDKILQRILAGALKNEEAEPGTHAFNYWWGMSSGVIDVLFSRKLPAGARRLGELLRSDICCGVYDPFTGLLTAQGGAVVQEGPYAQLTPEQILRIDWLCDNIVGHIPAFDELIDEAKPLVRLQGVLPPEEGAL